MGVIKIGGPECEPICLSNDLPFVLIAGPCQIQSRRHALDTAKRIKELTEPLGIPFIYKSSYDKANRTALYSDRGVGIYGGLNILDEVRRDIGVPVTTDVHSEGECALAGPVVDLLQIPALLSRQTDLLVAAAKHGRAVNIKKGQFMSPWDMSFAAAKVRQSGNQNVLATERGTSFGYGRLVNDMRGLPVMKGDGLPVVFDASHSVQLPPDGNESSGGERQFIKPLARAAVAIGVAAVFVEVHEDPEHAPSDGPSSLRLDDLPRFLGELQAIDSVVKAFGP